MTTGRSKTRGSRNNKSGRTLRSSRRGAHVEQLERRDLLAGDLIITGVVDGPLSGGTPKAIELYAAAPIADLSVYGIGSANNGGGSDGEEFTLSGSATSGQYIYVASEGTNFNSFFGFAPDFTDGAANINGDDAIELFFNGAVSDIFGDINTDGTGQPWEHLDGWAYRNNNTGPDGSGFSVGSWTYSGVDALDGESDNGTATSPFPIGTFSQVPAPEIGISDATSGIAIVSGDSTPSSADGTDFGPAATGATSVTRAFDISNSGTVALSLTGSPIVSISGSSDFSITTQPAANVVAAGSTSFVVTFDPTTVGNQTATISIANDDTTGGEDPYTFDVSGIVTSSAAPEIDIIGNGNSIVDGDTTPDAADGTDFGNVDTSGSSIQTFTIDNNAGSTALTISGVTFSGANAGDFSVSTAPPASIASGSTGTFDVTFVPGGNGLRTADISISSNDSDEASYNFALQGTGITVATNVVINEVDADTPTGDENLEFIELYDGGVGNTALDGLTLVFSTETVPLHTELWIWTVFRPTPVVSLSWGMATCRTSTSSRLIRQVLGQRRGAIFKTARMELRSTLATRPIFRTEH